MKKPPAIINLPTSIQHDNQKGKYLINSIYCNTNLNADRNEFILKIEMNF